MFPTEAVADAWNNDLSQLIAFIGMRQAVLDAIGVELGDLQWKITSVAMIPEQIYCKAMTDWSGIVQAYVAPVGAQPEVPETVPRLFPIGTGQAGLLWRIAQRIFWNCIGKAWDEVSDFDVLVTATEHTAVLGIGTPAPPRRGGAGGTGPSSALNTLKYSMA